jgi:drug/metabolite transporter (DMT)-like permease
MVYFILTLLIFSSMEVVSKPLMGVIDPFVLTFWRFALGSLFFLFLPGTVKRFSEVRKFGKKEWFSVFLLGILNTFLAMSFLQVAVKQSSASTAAAIFCSNPGFVFILSLFLGHEKLKILKVAGFLVGIAGILLIMSDRGIVFEYGILYAVAASVFFALYTVLGKLTVSGISSSTVNMTAFPFGVLANGIFIFVLGKDFFPDQQVFTDSSIIISFLYLGFVVTGIGYVAFFETIKRFSAVSVSLIFMFKPAVTLGMAFIFLNEKTDVTFHIGLVCVCLGTFFIVKDKINNLRFFP